jgi:dTDP-4-dehydrorhamnose reductase
MKIYILGIIGMLGSELFINFIKNKNFIVKGSTRKSSLKFFQKYKRNIDYNVSVNDIEKIKKNILRFKPHCVINCVGSIKQKIGIVKNYKKIFYTNSVFPHKIYSIIKSTNIKLIHFSTDCVFNGVKGNYSEEDHLSANDIYGLSKYLGELKYPNTFTIRTSIIGHELNSSSSLIDWFLTQETSIKGYKKAIFSGLPTVELARIIRDYVIPHPHLRGVYNVSAVAITKYDLLSLVANVYNKKIEIYPDDQVNINRSLDSSKFCAATGYVVPSWPELIKLMHANK